MEAYEEAMRRTIKPGFVVLDIGTGAGIHALMAARFGARHVYAIEPADSVELAPVIARQNGLEDKITFIRDVSTRVELPEQVDVIVSDLHGTLPWYHHHIPTIVDARSRLLKKGGTLIPQADTVFAVPVEAPEIYAQYAEPWRCRPFGFDFDYVSQKVTNIYTRGRVEKEGFLAQVQKVADLDYRTISDPTAHFRMELRPHRPGIMHGLMVWFDTTVYEDIRLTSAPFEPEISYGSTFFPLAEAIEVGPDDTVSFEVRGVLQSDYVWIWTCEVVDSAGCRRASFRQNSLQGEVISLDRLKKRAPAFKPALNQEGEIDRSILNLMDGAKPLSEIAREIRQRHGDVFRDDEDALERVRALSERYG